MKTTIRCECGAIYEREEQTVVVRWRDPFNCLVCGREIEDWATARKAMFRLVRRPDRPPQSAPQS